MLGATILADFLRSNNEITLLDLKGNNIGPKGFLEIFQALKQNKVINRIHLKVLKSLQIPWNNLTSNGNLQALEELFQMMNITRSISHIDLQNNGIKSSGAAILSNIIRNSPYLTSIDLRWNDLSNQGVQIIVGSVHANGSIQSV